MIRLAKMIGILSGVTASWCGAAEHVEFNEVDIPGAVPQGFVWKSELPDDCPFEQSDLFNRVYFTGKHSDYLCGDTFYPSWASDGNMYSPWTDGGTDGLSSRSYPGEKAHTGHAVMIGEDPLNLTITNPSPPKNASALPYQGRYPAGSLVHDGIWYYGTYCLGQSPGVRHNGFVYNWPVLGPMPGFQISYDFGKTWEPSPLSPDKPLFPEPAEKYAPVKIGAPHFVDFGKNMEFSPDGKTYLIAMGAEANDPKPRPCIELGTDGEIYKECTCPGDNNIAHANLSWVTADQTYLARVTPSPETINDENAYEYFAGHDAKGDPIWSDDFDKIKPLIEWNNNMGCVTATYVPQLKKYLMCITDGWPTMAKMDSYFLESDNLTGPWKIISYMKDFGEQAYFLNFPSKFISENGKDMWLCYSANFSPRSNGCDLNFVPEGGRYGLCLHEMRFLAKGDKVPAPKEGKMADLFDGSIAPDAKITASSTANGFSVAGLVDGRARGYPDKTAEWISSGQKNGAWVKLEWDTAQNIDRILLCDCPNFRDQVLAGRLEFSDSSCIDVDQPLDNTAKKALEITFKQKNVTWVKFVILKTGKSTVHGGLSEMAVFPTGD